MKFNKIISVALSIATVVGISSCSDKGYWDEAPLEAGLSFQSSQYNENLAPGANKIVIPLDRTVSSGSETVNITFTPAANCPEDITVPSSVTFEAGKNTAEIVIDIANATPPYTYAGTLKFEGTPSYSGISALTIKCPVNYTWSSLGTGTFFDAWVMDDSDPYPVEILKADGFERYRVLNPYKAYYASADGQEDWADWISSSGPEYVEFWQLDNGNLYFNAYSSGLNYQAVAGQPITLYPWDALTGTQEGLDIWYEPGFAVLSPVYYIPNVGSYGQQQYSVQIELP